MKFKANLIDPTFLNTILLSLMKHGSSCIINLSSTSIYFLMSKEFTSGEEIYIELNSSAIVDNFIIESLADNKIPILINLANLQKAVFSGLNAYTIVIKLSKKNNLPCLSFQIQKSYLDQTFIHQDVPIIVESIERLSEVAEPIVPDAVVKFLMPKLKVCNKIIDRMKHFSNELKLEADNSGNLLISSETERVKVQTFFQGLHFEMHSELIDDRSSKFDLLINSKKFSNCLSSCSVIMPRVIVGCLVPSHALVINCEFDEYGSMTYYIPVLRSD